jgi:hypothetical protein
MASSKHRRWQVIKIRVLPFVCVWDSRPQSRRAERLAWLSATLSHCQHYALHCGVPFEPNKCAPWCQSAYVLLFQRIVLCEVLWLLELISSWQVESLSAGQVILSLLHNLKVHDSVDKSPQLAFVISQINPVRNHALGPGSVDRIMMMEAVRASETSLCFDTTRRCISERSFF